MYKRNYLPRSKPEKKNPVEVKRERMYDLLDLIQKKKELKYFDAQRMLGWGDGVMERITREVIAYFNDEIKFDKEIRTLYAIDMKIKNEVIKQ